MPFLLTIAAAFSTIVISGDAPPPPKPTAPTSPATLALNAAAGESKYCILLFRGTDDEATKALRASLQKIATALGEKVRLVEVDCTQATERPLIARFGLERSRMPMTLILAPNGAVTGAFTPDVTVTESAVSASLLSPAAAGALKAMQDRRMVLICVQGERTLHNVEALAAARVFASSPEAAHQVDVVLVDPRDPVEASFVKQMAIDPDATEAVTIFMAPPGKRLATYIGSVEVATIAATARGAGVGCDPSTGCCAPKGAATGDAAKNPGGTR